MFLQKQIRRVFQQPLSNRTRLLGVSFLVALLCLVFIAAGGRQQLYKADASVLHDSKPLLQNSLEASVSVPVQVPVSMRSSPFNINRNLTVPPNFAISVYARIANARFMTVAPNGDVLVSRPGGGEVKIIRASTTGGDPTVSTFVGGLRNPHDIVFHTTASGTTYVYISESHQINRFTYTFGDSTAQNRQIVIANLPDASSSELGGSYGHQLKNIALDSNDKLYLSIASATNASPTDATSNPVRCAIYQYNADGTGGRLFARGLRNAEGLAILPGSNELWVVVNNRDNIAYPFHNDWRNDGTGDDYGKVMQSYVDNHPPEEFTRVRDGGNYGFPYANPNPDSVNGFNNMPFDLDVQNNPNGQYGTVDSFDRVTKGIQVHSAPLGVSFTGGTSFPAAYQPGAVVGLHGSWNRSALTGYKVVYFPYEIATQTLGDQINLVTGWETSGSVWGKPVDAVVDGQGNLLISDDQSGTIYKLTYTATPPSPTPTPTPTTTPTATPTPTPTPAVPNAPSNLTASTVTSTQITLGWNDNSSNESGFRIERSPDGLSFTQIGLVGANTKSFTNTGLARNRNYYYRVRAYNAAGDSAYSNTLKQRTSRK